MHLKFYSQSCVENLKNKSESIINIIKITDIKKNSNKFPSKL